MNLGLLFQAKIISQTPLTSQSKYGIVCNVMATYSTMQVTQMVGISRMTLLRWLRTGKLREPRRIGNGGIEARIWNIRDVERVRKYKEVNYRKGRGRKKAVHKK